MKLEASLQDNYDYLIYDIKRCGQGVGGKTFFVKTNKGKRIVKFSNESGMKHTSLEVQVCKFLNELGIKTNEFLLNKNGEYFTKLEGETYTVKKYIEGFTLPFHSLERDELLQMGSTLGKIHYALKDFPNLSVGIGEGFFSYMTPERAKESYLKTLEIAKEKKDKEIIKELEFRIKVMDHFPFQELDFNQISMKPTHGDYSVNQLIFQNHHLDAVIDFTTVCIHPAVWEIIRSYCYASKNAVEGIDINEFISYVNAYLKEDKLTTYDLEKMPYLFFYQISVCDYYRQFYDSKDINHDFFLFQAQYSTTLMHWFLHHMKEFEGNLRLLKNK